MILCMFSGGLDSTGMVYHILTHPDYASYEIHVHYVEMVNKENRWRAENAAVSKCIEWFKNNCREFTFTKNSIDFLFFEKGCPRDADVTAFIGSQIIRQYSQRYKFMTLGMTGTDNMSTRHMATVATKSQAIVDACLMGSNSEVKKTYPLMNLSKKEIWDMLPEELRQATWSCRRPLHNKDYTSWKPCCKCRSCKERQKVGIPLYGFDSLEGVHDVRPRILENVSTTEMSQ